MIIAGLCKSMNKTTLVFLVVLLAALTLVSAGTGCTSPAVEPPSQTAPQPAADAPDVPEPPDTAVQEANMLRRTVASRAQRLGVAEADNGEPMVKANSYDATIVVQPALPDMKDITGDDIYVRDEVAHMLADANARLQLADLNLIVGYGYRAPAVQEQYWNTAIEKVRQEHPNWSEDQIEEEADHYAADPQVAGHITGGCVDLTIGRGDKPLDMGAALDDFTAAGTLIKTFGEGITAEQMSNRMLLYQVMTEVGFMPFFAEYWHFMYGDREWAYFSGLDASLYGPLNFKPPSNL
jgi:D-alanyl-D-alanine dipeptidase